MPALTVEQAFQIASAHQSAGRWAAAETLYQQVLAAEPGHAESCYRLGLLALATGRHQAARDWLQKAVAFNPAQAAYHGDLGAVWRCLGSVEEAISCYRRALSIQPGFVDALVNLGEVLIASERIDEAISTYDQVLEIRPGDAEALNNLGNALGKKGRTDEAINCLRKALVLMPDYVEAHYNLGSLLWQTGDVDQAVPLLQQAVTLNPDFGAAWLNLGCVLLRIKRPDEAIASLRRAVALMPRSASAHSNLGAALIDQNALLEGIESCLRATTLDAEHGDAYRNLCAAYLKLDQIEKAISSGRHAARFSPNCADAHWNLSVALLRASQYEEAARACREAIACRADFADPHANLGLILLLLGQYREGWKEHEWRWQSRACATPRRNFPAPPWDGSPAPGRTILVHAEQGFGDTIQFLRYLPLVRAKADAARVIFECPPELARLLAHSRDWNAEIVARRDWEGTGLPAFDRHVPLLSLPWRLGWFEPMGAPSPYLCADEKRRTEWKTKLGAAQGLRVGVVNAGSPVHTNDRNRSLPLEKLAPLFEIAGITFHSLRPLKDHRPAIAESGLIDWSEHLLDFSDTAALIAHLDLVITVDTAVAHLAGALGKPVWILLPFSPDWRWGLESEETPWYPTMRLLRQSMPGDWTSVVVLVGRMLRALVERGVGFRREASIE